MFKIFDSTNQSFASILVLEFNIRIDTDILLEADNYDVPYKAGNDEYFNEASSVTVNGIDVVIPEE